jgi:hypothetical protein
MVAVAFVLLAILSQTASGVMLRGIGGATLGSSTVVASPFTAAAINAPIGSGGSGGLTTPSPYQTFSASWTDVFTIGWTPPPNAFAYNMDRVNRLTPDAIHPFWGVLKTASPIFPIPRLF